MRLSLSKTKIFKDEDFQIRKHILSELSKLDKLKEFFGY